MSDLDLPREPAALVAAVLEWAVRERATDIHLSPLAEGGRIRARVDGLLRDLSAVEPSDLRKAISRIKVLADIDIAEKRRPQDGRLTTTVDDRPVDFRVSVIPTLHGESAVLRVLDRAAGLRTIDQLGLSRREAGVFRSMIAAPSGLVVITGPTGAGKTTTLYAALLELASPERNVVTIEDPIEYEVPRAIQTGVRSEIDVSFAALLRGILRHDPDVILVGEIRDPETAQIAVRAALTGHLVLTSLHTLRASEAVSALLHLGVKSYALAPALRGVMAQQLVRLVCPECRTVFEHGDEVLEDPDFARALAEGQKPSFSVGLGCAACLGSGYRGRRAIFEVLEVTDRVRQAVIRGRGAAEIEQAAIENGMLTLRQRGFQAVLDGTTTVEEVVRAVSFE